jgi:transcriptional regulator
MFTKKQAKEYKKLLKENGWNQSEMAREWFFTRQYINNVLSGRYESIKLEDRILDLIDEIKRGKTNDSRT